MTWDKTICSLDKHCPEGTECENGEMCYTIPRCNVHDLTTSPTPNPTQSPIFNREHISHMKFCGTDVTDAVIKCSLETHCRSDEACPIGTSCFDTPPGRSCNAYDMRPTTSPSSRDDVKTATPTRHPVEVLLPKQFCGKTWASISCSKEAWFEKKNVPAYKKISRNCMLTRVCQQIPMMMYNMNMRKNPCRASHGNDYLITNRRLFVIILHTVYASRLRSFLPLITAKTCLWLVLLALCTVTS